MRLYTHDLEFIPGVEPEPGDCIEPLDRNRGEVLLDVYAVDPVEDRTRWDRGEKCFVGWSAGRAAHYGWVQDAGVHEIRGTWRRETIQSGDFWIYSCRTADWARGRRLYPAALVSILRTYKSLSYRRALIYVADENTASINGIERAGFELAESIRSLACRNSLLWLPGSSYQRQRRVAPSRQAKNCGNTTVDRNESGLRSASTGTRRTS
jgi:RimJ/RimL family protein N-acetyltransferase